MTVFARASGPGVLSQRWESAFTRLPCERGLPAYSGSLKYPGMSVAPLPGEATCRRTYTWNQNVAYREALRFFVIDDKPQGALL